MRGTHSSSLSALRPDAVMSPRNIMWWGLKCIAKCQLFLRCRLNNKLSKAVRSEEVHEGAIAGFLIWVSETTSTCEKCLLCRKGVGSEPRDAGSRRKARQRTEALSRFSGHRQSLRLKWKNPISHQTMVRHQRTMKAFWTTSGLVALDTDFRLP